MREIRNRKFTKLIWELGFYLSKTGRFDLSKTGRFDLREWFEWFDWFNWLDGLTNFGLYNFQSDVWVGSKRVGKV